jgi:glutamate N-acetyltransferase/amino-acid N-acetyltransferase
MLGIAKGSGMIMPDMATMLAFVVTDAAAEPAYLRACLEAAAAPTLNSLTVDGETSTSDTLLVLANGAAGGPVLRAGSPGAAEFESTLHDVCRELADKIALDGEGVTRLAEIEVKGARNDAQARQVARKVANSMLFKTALFGSDPNWGRVVQAVGAAGVPFSPSELDVAIGGVQLLKAGEPSGGPSAIVRAERAMKKKRVRVEIVIGAGEGTSCVLTTDLTYDYVKINADYTT